MAPPYFFLIIRVIDNPPFGFPFPGMARSNLGNASPVIFTLLPARLTAICRLVALYLFESTPRFYIWRVQMTVS